MRKTPRLLWKAKVNKKSIPKMSSNAQVRSDLREIGADKKNLPKIPIQRKENLRLEVRKPKMCRNKTLAGELLP